MSIDFILNTTYLKKLITETHSKKLLLHFFTGPPGISKYQTTAEIDLVGKMTFIRS